MKRKIITLLFIFSISMSSTASAMESPIEHCFGYKHPSITYYSAYRNASYTIGALDTYTADSALIHTGLTQNGYYNQFSFCNNPASPVQNSIGNDAIFYISAHGGEGRVACVDGNASNANVTLLTATAVKDTMAYSLLYKYGNTTNKLKKVHFAFFNSCHSAATDTTWGYGNLLDTCYSLGVDCTLGFTGTVNTDTGAYFAKRVILYYGMDSNNTVLACVTSAKRDTYSTYGTYGGVDTYTFKGDSSIKLVPSTYGTY